MEKRKMSDDTIEIVGGFLATVYCLAMFGTAIAVVVGAIAFAKFAPMFIWASIIAIPLFMEGVRATLSMWKYHVEHRNPEPEETLIRVDYYSACFDLMRTDYFSEDGQLIKTDIV